MKKKKMPKKKSSSKKVVRVNPKSKPQYLVLPDGESPLVYVDFALRLGAVADPDGKEGLTSLTLSMLLRGTKKYSAREFHEELDGLGAEIHLGKHKESLRIYGVVLKENLKPFLALLKEVIGSPRFDAKEFEKLKRQFQSALMDEMSSDDDIADRRFQEHLFWGHPYSKMISGNLASIDSISLADVELFYRRNFSPHLAVCSALGDFKAPVMRKQLQALVKVLPGDLDRRIEVPRPSFYSEPQLLLLNKPQRTQSQILVGTPGISFHDKDYSAMQLANHVFGGGSFSARLMHEVREKRGWSYGAYAYYRASRNPICYSMQTVPATKDSVSALKLMIQLLQEYAKKGITKAEFDFAKKSLINQAAFLQDTPRKKLDNKVNEILLDLPKGYYDNYLKRLKALTWSRVQKAIKDSLRPQQLFVVLLGDADELSADLKRELDFFTITRREFDEPPAKLV